MNCIKLKSRVAAIAVATLAAISTNLILSATAETGGHPVRGVVVEKLEERRWLMVDHEEIPDFMPAMVMAFTVEDSLYPLLQPGMVLTARMTLGGPSGWQLEDVRVLAREGDRLRPGLSYEVPLAPSPAAPSHSGAVRVTVPAPGRWRFCVDAKPTWLEVRRPDGAALSSVACQHSLPPGFAKGVVYDLPAAGEYTIELSRARTPIARLLVDRLDLAD
jgi:hypothetical protein